MRDRSCVKGPMAGFKGAFACSVTLAALAIAQPASALIMVSASDGGTTISGCTANDGGTGTVSASCSDGNFSAVTFTATGVPMLLQPGLSSNSLSVTDVASGSHTLTIDAVQTGLSFAGDITATLGINILTGTGTMATLEADAPAGTPILEHTFSAPGTTGPVSITLGQITSDALIFSLSFSGPGQIGVSLGTVDAVVPASTPEPASLAMLGTAVAGLGVFGIRRRRQRVVIASRQEG